MTESREAVLYFDGDADYIKVADSEALRVNNYTVEVWMKTDGVPNEDWKGIVGKPGRNHHILLHNKGNIFHCFHTTADTNINYATPQNSLEWNKWQHIAITNDGTTAKTYINGELIKESPTGQALVVDKTQLIMGANLDGGGGQFFKGQLTEVRLWNKVRSENEIKGNMFRRLKGDEEGLAGYWPLNDVANNTASDETENENHGKVYGAVIDEQLPFIGGKGKGTDKREYVLKFDGNGDYVQVDNPPNPTDAITVSCWAKGKAISSSELVFKHNSYVLRSNANSKTFYFFIYSGGWFYKEITLTDLDLTKWHHYAGTFDGKIIRLYVDGVEVANKVFSGKISKNSKSMYIGYDERSWFNGKITEVQVWNKALSAKELTENMKHRLNGDEAGLVGYWPLDKGHGDIATDETSNKKHGKIVKAVWDEQFPIGVVPTVTIDPSIKYSTITAPKKNNLAMEVMEGQTTDVKLVVPRNLDQNNDLQKWTMSADGVIKPALGDFALDLFGPSPREKYLVIKPIDGSATQKWELTSTGMLQNKGNGFIVILKQEKNNPKQFLVAQNPDIVGWKGESKARPKGRWEINEI